MRPNPGIECECSLFKKLWNHKSSRDSIQEKVKLCMESSISI